MAQVTTYCTDADILVHAKKDFAMLAPADQIIARGTDGVIDPASPWVLTSATEDFGAYGVRAGHVVQLSGPAFKREPEWFEAPTVSGHSITLARTSFASGITGRPPTGTAGASGITFMIPTLFPQIENASHRLNILFGIDAIRGILVSDLYDQRDLRDSAVYYTLAEVYRSAAKSGSEQEDTFLAKSHQYAQKFEEVTSALTLRIRPRLSGQDAIPRAARVAR